MSVFVEVVSQFAGHADGVLRAVVPAEEGLRVPARDDAGALVVQQGGRVALEDQHRVAEPAEDDACEEAAQAAADLGGKRG